MKDNKLIILLIIFSSLIWTACKKAAVTDLVPTAPITLSADSNYLSKILFLRGNGSTIDTSINIFNYDNLKRVSQFIETRVINSNGTITKYLDTSKYQYNTSELLPYKITKRVNNPTGIDTILNYLFYSVQGILIKDSLLSFSYPTGGNPVIRKQIRLFSYSNNNIYIHLENQIINPTGNNYIQNDTLSIDGNNNIIQKRSSNNTTGSSVIINYTYGNNPSPMINLNIWNKLGILYNDQDFYLIQGLKNNLTSLISSVYNNNGVLQATAITLGNLDIYTFKNNGYPNSLKFQFPMSPNSKSIVYVYKSL